MNALYPSVGQTKKKFNYKLLIDFNCLGKLTWVLNTGVNNNVSFGYDFLFTEKLNESDSSS